MNDLFLRACRGEPVERTPIWLMRQAGRSLPEYRELRARFDFETLCRTPELAARATLQPVERLGVDAAILFSDILVLAEPLGFRLAFTPGPRLEPVVRSAADVDRVRDESPEARLGFVFETLRRARHELGGRAPLIGFAGAPWTVACYLVEGGGSRAFERARALVAAEPSVAHRLLEKIASATERYLSAQIDAGAQALQLFDTWAGLLAPGPYREFALRYVRRVLDGLRGRGVPLIYFALGAGHLLESIRECGADVVGVDWRTDLGAASAALGGRFVLQGNLDPAVLLAPAPAIEAHAAAVLERARGLRGHVFNLGHGVLPETAVDRIETLVRFVQSQRRTAAR